MQLDPAMFDYYIAMDPSIWWNDRYAVRSAAEHLKNLPSKQIKFWFAGSGVQKNDPFITNLTTVLKAENPSSLTWKYVDKPEEQHHTIFRATKEEALTWAMGEE